LIAGETDEQIASPAQANRSWVGLRSSLPHSAMARCHASAADSAARCEMSERAHIKKATKLLTTLSEVEKKAKKLK